MRQTLTAALPDLKSLIPTLCTQNLNPKNVLLTQTSLGNGRHDPVGRISDAASRNTSQGRNKESGAQLNVYHPKD